jgi:hypothetical protein
LRPAELISLSNMPASAEMQHPDVEMQHELLVDVIVDAQGQMSTYEIIVGPDTPEMRHHLDQVLLFSRFRPMLSFGRPTPAATWCSASAPSMSAAKPHL